MRRGRGVGGRRRSHRRDPDSLYRLCARGGVELPPPCRFGRAPRRLGGLRRPHRPTRAPGPRSSGRPGLTPRSGARPGGGGARAGTGERPERGLNPGSCRRGSGRSGQERRWSRGGRGSSRHEERSRHRGRRSRMGKGDAQVGCAVREVGVLVTQLGIGDTHLGSGEGERRNGVRD